MPMTILVSTNATYQSGQDPLKNVA